VKDEPHRRALWKRLTKIFSIITGISLGSTFLVVVAALVAITLFVRTQTFQSALKNRVVEIVRSELEAEISYQAANLDVFSLTPSISFEQIVFEPKNPELKTELKRFELGISVFSLPLLALNQLVIARAVIDGLTYRISDLEALERWLDSVRPKKTVVPLKFRTSVQNISLVDARLDVNLKSSKLFPADVDGSFSVETFQVGLDSDVTNLSGLVTFRSLKAAGWGPFDGQIMLDRAGLGDEGLDFRNFKIVSNEDFLEFSGRISDLVNPRLDVKGVTSFRLENFLRDQNIEGGFKSSFRLKGPLAQIDGDGRLSASDLMWKKKRFELFDSEWVLKKDLLTLKQFTANSGGESIVGQGSFPLTKGQTYQLKFDFKNASIRDYVASADETLHNWRGSASGSAEITGVVSDVPAGSVALQLQLTNLDMRTKTSNRSIFATPSVSAKVTGEFNTASESNLQFQLDVGSGPWSGSARLTQQRMDMSWTARLDGRKAGTLFDYALAVKGDMPGSLSGEWDKLELLVKPNIETLQLNKQVARNLKGNLRYVNRRLLADPLVADEVSLSGGIYLPSGNKDYFENFKFKVNKIDLREFFGYLNFTPEEIWLATGVLSGDGFFTGDVDEPRGAGNVIVEKWGFGDRLSRGHRASAQWAWSKSVFYLSDCLFLLGSKDEGISGEFTIDARGFSNASFVGDRLRISDWFYLAGMNLNFQSLSKLNFSYQRDLPSLQASLETAEASVDGTREGESKFSFDWVGDRLKADLNLFAGGLSASLKSGVTGGIQRTELGLDFGSLNLSPWVGFLSASRLSAVLQGSGKLTAESKFDKSGTVLSGMINHWNRLTGEVDIRTAEVKRTSLVLQKVEPFRLKVRPGRSSWLRFEADAINILSSDGLRLQLKGFYESPAQFELRASGRTDLRAISGLSPTLSRSEGVLETEGVLNPQGFSGRLALSRGLVTFQDSPLVIRNVEADLRANQSDFEIQRLSGALREGTIQAKGRVKLTTRGVESARISIELGNTLFQPQDGISLRASGPLELRVSASDGELSGRLQIFDGLFRRRVDLRSDIVRLFKSRKIDFKASEFEDMPWQNWKLKVSIDSGDPFNVRNNLAEGSANLRLVLGGTLREMRISGNVDIVRGQFAFNNRQFAIRSGSIVFQNPSTNVPNYDIRAETEIGDYRIFVKLFGGPDEQKISYSSDPVLSEKDILSVISFGLPSSSEELKSQDPTRAVSLTGISFVTGQLQDQIEGRLSRDFGVQRFSLGPAFFEETGRTELQLMVGTDLIRNRLGVNYSQFLSAEGGQKVELDLKMSRNLSLIGSWREVREEGKSTDDFGGDFRFRFEVE
jgi:hypothetical protein